MKLLKVLVVMSLVFSTSVFAKNITAKDLGKANISVQDVNSANKVYASCLSDYDNHCCDAIIMVVMKQKMLYPTADYDCLVKPLKRIIAKSDNEKLINNAITALIVISKDFELNLTEKQLYNFNVNEFFNFVNYQLPKNLVLFHGSQEMVKQ